MPVSFRPKDGASVRFVTSISLSQNIVEQGIDGFYKDGRFWSKDMADHWTIYEVTGWEHRAALAPASPHKESRSE